MKNLTVALGVVFSLSSSLPAMAEELFPEPAVYSKSQLAKDYTNVLIIDARSSTEFDKLHIRGAINIPIRDKRFTKRISALRKQTTQRMVFYSNGHNCQAAYRAARAAMQARVKDVFVYDAGVHEWKKDYPLQVVTANDGSSLLQSTQIAQQL